MGCLCQMTESHVMIAVTIQYANNLSSTAYNNKCDDCDPVFHLKEIMYVSFGCLFQICFLKADD